MFGYSLQDSIETSGEWYTPDEPDHHVSGSLSYGPNGFELKLDNALQPLLSGTITEQNTSRRYPMIYGLTRESEAITLINAVRANLSLNMGSGGLRQPERIVGSLLVVGAHLPPDFLFPSISFRIPGLQIWNSHPLIKREFGSTEGEDEKTIHIKVSRPTNEVVRVPNIFANLEWGTGYENRIDPFSSIALTMSGWLHIKPDEPQTLNWYFEQVSTATALLTYLAGCPMSADSIQASLDNSPRKVSILGTWHNRSYCPYTNIHEFYLARGALQLEFARVLEHWFEIYQKIKTPSQLGISTMASKELWLHTEFLSLIQSLEGLHRALYDGTYMDRQKYEAVKSSLTNAIPSTVGSDHRASLASRIRYGNEVSLAKRLDALSTILPDPIRKQIFGEGGKVPRRWVDTRNYYTHWDEALRKNLLEDEEIFHVNARLRHFLRTLFVIYAGVPNDALIAAMNSEHNEVRFLRQINAS